MDGGSLHVRQSAIGEGAPAVLFIHGLGESGLCFREAFEMPSMAGFNLIVPDLPGYGRSRFMKQRELSMASHVECLLQLMDNLGISSFFIIGHSMGGDLGVMLASSGRGRRVRGLINIEGDLTPHDIFFSNMVVSAAEQGVFADWFKKDFMEELVLERWGRRWASCRRYYTSLQTCSPEVFLANAREMFLSNQPVALRKECITGASYAALAVPKLFCWGSESLAEGTLDFLEEASLDHRGFTPAFHWPMIDCAEEFYACAADFLAGIT